MRGSSRWLAPPLSLLSWSLDQSERSFHGSPRRIPRHERLREILNVVRTTAPTVVCVQDSSDAVAEGLCHSQPGQDGATYQQVCSARNGKHGCVQTFVRTGPDVAWKAVALKQYSFATIELRHDGDVSTPIRITNVDLSYRGKGLPVLPLPSGSSTNGGGTTMMDKKKNDGGSGGLNESSWPTTTTATGSNRRQYGELDAHRKVAIELITSCIQPHIVCGNSYMAGSETLQQSLYADAWAASGADPEHELTTDTMPMYELATTSEEQQQQDVLPPPVQTNFFYLTNPLGDLSMISHPPPHTRRALAAIRNHHSSRGGEGVSRGRIVMWPPCKAALVASKELQREQKKEQLLQKDVHHNTTVAGRYQRTFIRKTAHNTDTPLLKRYSQCLLLTLRPMSHALVPPFPVSPSDQFPTLLSLI